MEPISDHYYLEGSAHKKVSYEEYQAAVLEALESDSEELRSAFSEQANAHK